MDDKLLKTRVTIYEVAKQAGVSLATVSRVINKTGNVSDNTVERVNTVIAKLGYQPSNLAQGLAKSRSKTIALVIPAANYVYISNLVYGITEVAKERGVNLLLFSSSHSSIDAYKVIENVIKSHVDGAVVFDDELNSEDIKFINSYSVPCVVINHTVTGEKAACITFDHENIMHNLVKENILSNGKEMIFIHIHNGGRLLNRVEKAFIEENETAKRSYQIINCDDSYTHTYEDFIEYFKSHNSGYFVVYRDSIAIAVANAALDSGLKIPEDIEIVSIVGTKYANIMRPKITSMNVDFQEVGRRAMNMLSDLYDETLNEKVCKFETKLVKRESTLK